MLASVTLYLVLPLVSTAPQGGDESSTKITTVARWGPVHSSTYKFMERHADARKAMQSGPAVKEAAHQVASLRALLPSKGATVGDVWTIPVDSVLPMLAQFHPSVTKRLRHANVPAHAIKKMGEKQARARVVMPAVEGGRATLLSIDEQRMAILLRVHVEFELIPKKMWLLPAQYEGHLIWDRVRDVPVSLHLRLPPRDTNWDINHHLGGADIGYLPLMEVATAHAKPAGPEADTARQLMREAFYPAAKIHWQSLPDAFRRAKKNGRLLHVMQLFGTLDDESC